MRQRDYKQRSILIVQKQWAIARALAVAFEAKGARVLSARDAPWPVWNLSTILTLPPLFWTATVTSYAVC
jgi:hypothetical protein